MGSAHARPGPGPGVSQPRILLVFPVFSQVYPPAFLNFLRLVIVASRYCPYRFEPYVIERQLLHGAMNQAVDVVLADEECAGMISFDDDCLPYMWEFQDPRRFQVIPRMLGLWAAGRGEIIAGVGYMRGHPHTTTVGRWYREGMTAFRDQKMFKGFYWVDDLRLHEKELDDQGLLTADFCGMPIMFISRKVLKALKPPIFETTDEQGGPCTHDIAFCKKATEAGFKVIVDTHIDCGHIIQAPIVDKFTRPFARQQDALVGVQPNGTPKPEPVGAA